MALAYKFASGLTSWEAVETYDRRESLYLPSNYTIVYVDFIEGFCANAVNEQGEPLSFNSRGSLCRQLFEYLYNPQTCNGNWHEHVCLTMSAYTNSVTGQMAFFFFGPMDRIRPRMNHLKWYPISESNNAILKLISRHRQDSSLTDRCRALYEVLFTPHTLTEWEKRESNAQWLKNYFQKCIENAKRGIESNLTLPVMSPEDASRVRYHATLLMKIYWPSVDNL